MTTGVLQAMNPLPIDKRTELREMHRVTPRLVIWTLCELWAGRFVWSSDIICAATKRMLNVYT